MRICLKCCDPSAIQLYLRVFLLARFCPRLPRSAGQPGAGSCPADGDAGRGAGDFGTRSVPALPRRQLLRLCPRWRGVLPGPREAQVASVSIMRGQEPGAGGGRGPSGSDHLLRAVPGRRLLLERPCHGQRRNRSRRELTLAFRLCLVDIYLYVQAQPPPELGGCSRLSPCPSSPCPPSASISV